MSILRQLSLSDTIYRPLKQLGLSILCQKKKKEGERSDHVVSPVVS